MARNCPTNQTANLGTNNRLADSGTNDVTDYTTDHSADHYTDLNTDFNSRNTDPDEDGML